jgi:hypothetical protein
MAPKSFPVVLDLEGPPRTTQAATCVKETREPLRKMSRENPLWGAPRIHGELARLGIDIGATSVSKYNYSTGANTTSNFEKITGAQNNSRRSSVSMKFRF